MSMVFTARVLPIIIRFLHSHDAAIAIVIRSGESAERAANASLDFMHLFWLGLLWDAVCTGSFIGDGNCYDFDTQGPLSLGRPPQGMIDC